MRWMFVGGGAWTPDLLSDLVVWLDADDTAFANDDAVDEVTNKGTGGNATQSDSTKRPVFKTNVLNGKPAIEFDGTNDCLQIGSLSLDTLISCFVVAKTTTAKPMFIEHGVNASTNDGFYFYGSSQAHFSVRRSTTRNEYTGTAQWLGASAAQAAMVINAIASAPSPMGKVYKNGTVQSDGSAQVSQIVADSSIAATLNIFARNNGASVASDGDLHEVLIYNAPLSTEDRQRVEGYLAWKWGLEGDLPAGHPYESAAPSA